MKTANLTLEHLKSLLAGLASRVTGFQPDSFRVGALEKIVQEKTAEGSTLKDLFEQVSQAAPEILGRLYEAIPVGETYFFRQPEHFDYLKSEAPASPRREAFKVWSAGCATGEETYSLAACLRDAHPELEVLGTDLSEKHLEIARKGAYSTRSLRRSGEELYQVFEKPLHPPYQVGSGLKALARFHQHNLLDPPPPGPFDVIFCRNVLVYFTLPAARQVVKNFVASLSPNGLLFPGPSDISFSPAGLKPHGPARLSIYKKAPASRPKAAGPRPKSIRKAPTPPPFPLRTALKAAPKGKEKSDPISLHLAVLEAMEMDYHPVLDRHLKQLRRKFPDYLPGLYEIALWNARNKNTAVAKGLMGDLLSRLKTRDFRETIPGPRDLTVDFYLASALTFLKREES